MSKCKSAIELWFRMTSHVENITYAEHCDHHYVKPTIMTDLVNNHICFEVLKRLGFERDMTIMPTQFGYTEEW